MSQEGSIFPLPVFEADADPQHRDGLTESEAYARLESPKTIVVRFGRMKNVGEYPYSGDAKPGCGTKMVVRTHRGTEVGEMLTTTCENSGCGKSVSRQELLDYIELSGGRDYPFSEKGRVLRVATVEDLQAQSALDTERTQYIKTCREYVEELGLDMKLVDVEFIFGGELVTFYYMSEDRVDFRELVHRLAAEFSTRIEMRQVGARDEARLVADYERCGQYCCCKGFLKVLKPVSMKSAKVQKATLDPLKISGRCGRLMCCLRYEDQTYADLKKRLPRRRSRVGTPEGPGLVIDTKILVQLVLVRLEEDNREIAVAVEDLSDPDEAPRVADPMRGFGSEQVEGKVDDGKTPVERRRRRRRRKKGGAGEDTVGDAGEELRGGDQAGRRAGDSVPDAERPAGLSPKGAKDDSPSESADSPAKKRRRRRRRKRGGGGGGAAGPKA